MEHHGHSVGATKHRTAGHAVNAQHFTGKKAGKRIGRKSKKSKKQRTHVNKYAG